MSSLRNKPGPAACDSSQARWRGGQGDPLPGRNSTEPRRAAPAGTAPHPDSSQVKRPPSIHSPASGRTPWNENLWASSFPIQFSMFLPF